jgi:hypothetical protein
MGVCQEVHQTQVKNRHVGAGDIMKYRICWKQKGSTYVEKSDAVLGYSEAKQIAEDLNQEFPSIEHWVEPGEVE